MKAAKDVIVFPLDVPSPGEARSLVKLLADDVGMFKVGLELFIRSGPELVRWIRQAGSAKVFLDLKLHDIPTTVKRAMAQVAGLGVYFATVHCGESRAMLDAGRGGGGPPGECARGHRADQYFKRRPGRGGISRSVFG
jgi:orotidine-5'-phosphate decarboxylase